MYQFNVKTSRRNQLIEITGEVEKIVSDNGKDSSAVLVYVPHTTAGVTINENADPSVAEDMLHYFETMVPKNMPFRHSEGNSDAHIKSTLVGTSVIIPIENGLMSFGTWQGIYFAEFDGPRTRTVRVQLLS
jgi:secondary thiamine-phosphate synthase enzyme